MATNPKTTVEVSAKNNTAAGLAEAKAAVNSFGDAVKSSLEGAFAVLGAGAIGEFFKASIEQSIKAETNFTDLAVALRNVGADASVAAPQIQALVEQLGSSTGTNIDDINAAMNRLITSTGSYQKAMVALPVVLDVAKARHMDVMQAATLVSKAFDGNVGALKRLGVTVQEGQTPFDALRASYKGFAEEEGKGVEGSLGRLMNGWRGVLQAVGDAIVGNDQMSDATTSVMGTLKDLETFLKVNHQAISDFAGIALTLAEDLAGTLFNAIQVLVKAFQGLQALWVVVSDSFTYGAQNIKEAFGDVVSGIGNMISMASGVLDKFGIHFADGVAARMIQAGKQITTDAQKAAQDIQTDQDTRLAAIFNPKAAAPKALPKIGPKVTDDSAGTPAKKKDTADKDFRERVAGDTALLALDDKRAQGLADLNKLAADELKIINDKSATDKERVTAAERYGQVQKALEADETKRYNDSFGNAKAELDMQDKRTEGLRELNTLAAQELAIANDTTQSVHEREQALTRYKALTDAINADDQKEFAAQLAADKGLLLIVGQRQSTMAKLTIEAEQQKAISLDATKTDAEREKAAQRLQAIISATGGKLHLAMTGRESFDEMTKGLQDMADTAENLNNVLGELGGTTLNNLTTGLGQAFAAIGQGASVFDTLAKAAQKAVGDAAKAEGQHEIGLGMGMIAQAAWPPNPAALAAAGLHFAAGAFLEALGGALGGSGGSSGGGSSGGGSGGYSGNSAVSSTQNALAKSQPSGQIVVQGGLLNLNDPVQADQLANAIQTVYGLRMVITGNTNSTVAMY